MTADRATRRFSPLALRLAGSLAAVALIAVLVLSGLMLWRTANTVDQLAADRQQSSADAVASTLAADYSTGRGWSGADPHPAMMLAVQADASLTVRDASGQVVDLGIGQMHPGGTATPAADGVVRSAPVMVDGRQVGTVELTFARGALADAEIHVRDTLWTTTLLGAAIAVVLSLAVAVPLARRITKPISEVQNATRRLAGGDSSARAGHHDAPGEIGELATTFDRMADTLQAQDRARRDLIADVAHELRTPLTLLEGNCEEVLDGLAEPSVERVASLHDDVLRLRRIVEDLAALAEADDAASQLQIRSEPVDLAVVATASVERLRAQADAKGHTVVTDLSPSAVDGDPVRLGQVVTNLVANAIKFTPDGGTLRIRTGEGPDGSVRLEVIDTGPGIDPGDLPHIFERFYRAAAARPVSGSGIGLAVVDQLVRAHHGTVTAANGDPHGAILTVELPAAARRRHGEADDGASLRAS